MGGNNRSWKLTSFATLSDTSTGQQIDEVDGFHARDEALLCAARTLAGGDRMLRSGSVVKVTEPNGMDIVLMRVELTQAVPDKWELTSQDQSLS